MSHPTELCDGVLVVFEGQARVRWRRSPAARFSPAGLWPDAREAAEVRRHIGAGRPLLVVLQGGDGALSLFGEQLAEAPPEIAALAGDATGELVDVRIPPLDWLPAQLRRRGLRFLRSAASRTAPVPSALLPSVVLDEPDAAVPHVRFARQLRPFAHLGSELSAVVQAAFRPLALAA